MDTKEKVMTDKEFWEKCGFTIEEMYPDEDDKRFWRSIDSFGEVYASALSSDDPTLYPPIEPNNLFKYAVPKIKPKTLMMETYDGGYEFAILSEKQSEGLWIGRDKDPATALKKAISEVL